MLAALYNIYTLLKDDPAEVHCSTVHRTKFGWGHRETVSTDNSLKWLKVIVSTFISYYWQCVFMWLQPMCVSISEDLIMYLHEQSMMSDSRTCDDPLPVY